MKQLRHGQWVLYGLLAVGLTATLVVRTGKVSIPDGGAVPDPARVAAVAHKIDPNAATWVELALLPGLGETLAKRIVAHREAVRAETGPRKAVFTRLEDLDAIQGIGSGKIARLEGLLVFPDSEPDAGPDH